MSSHDTAEKQGQAGNSATTDGEPAGPKDSPLSQPALRRKILQRRAKSNAEAPDVDPAKKEGDAPNAQAPTTPSKAFLDQAAAQKLLTDAYGSLKTIDKGNIQVLSQADFQKAYDKIYGAGPYAWDKYVKTGPGNLEGFAHDNTNYINKDCISLDTVPHEMLHNNTAADWTDFVGSEFNEGTTEYLTIKAMNKAGKTPSHSYPGQEGCVRALVAAGLAESNLETAYLKGGAATLIGKFADDHCKGKWADIKTAMQAKDFAKAKANIAKK